MTLKRFVKESRIASPPSVVFAFFEHPDAFGKLIPPDEQVELLKAPQSLDVGTRVVIRTRLGPFPIEWEVEHIEYVPGRLFVDRQVRGPFAAWTHRHEFDDDGQGGTLLRDVVDYAPPGGMLGAAVGGRFLESKLEKLFDYRHQVIRKAVENSDGETG